MLTYRNISTVGLYRRSQRNQREPWTYPRISEKVGFRIQKKQKAVTSGIDTITQHTPGISHHY